MGLDIYLRKLTGGVTLEEAARIEDEYENRAEENWLAVGGYEAATEVQRDAVLAKNDALAKEMGLGEWGQHPARADAEVPASKVDPDHYFKLNYLRSSYNGSGFNAVMRNAGLTDLYGIFGRTNDDEYHWRPDWQASLEIYRREAGRDHPGDFLSYGNRDGDFYLDGLTVRALIPGITRGTLSGKPEPVVYAVIDAATEEGKEDWYLTALKITREMIEFVLAQPDADAYYLTWSA